MGRWKGSPQGPYWDAADTGPNQVDPPPGASPTGPQAQQPQQQAPQMPDPMQGPWRNAPDAGPGGMTGRMPGDLKQFPGGFPPIAAPVAKGNFWDVLKQGSAGQGGPTNYDPTQGTDHYTKESAPIGYFYPGSQYGDKDEYYKIHGGGGFGPSIGGGGPLSSLIGQAPAAKPASRGGLLGGAFNSLMQSPFGIKR